MVLKSQIFCILFFCIFLSKARADIQSIDPSFGLAPVVVSLPRQPEPSWIWNNEESTKQTLLFRKKFTLVAIPKNAFLFITANKSYDVFINGNKIGSSKFKIEDGWKNTGSYSIKKRLKIGENIIAVRVHSLNKGGLLARIENSLEKILWTDADWKVEKQKLINGNWTELNYDDSRWSFAEELGAASVKTFPDNTERG